MKINFKAFTLAEIMIVLSVIAVLTAILLPSARNAIPNEKILKFKKGHNTLLTTVSELVNSDKYYLNGDLGVKANGNLVLYANKNDHAYFMQTFADVLSVKYLDPKTGRLSTASFFSLFDNGCVVDTTVSSILDNCSNQEVTSATIQAKKNDINTVCNKSPSSEAKQVVTSDGIWYWNAYPYSTFGATRYGDETSDRFFDLKDSNGFLALYKLFCMDIDGVPENATATDCINECPFAYGINTEGKIFTSGRVDEWLEKSIQEKD